MKKKYFLIGFVSLFLFVFSIRATDYLLLIDASISMKRTHVIYQGQRHRRLDMVSEALTSFLRELPLGSRVYLAAFNRVVTPEAEMVVRSEADRNELIRSYSNLETLVGQEYNSGYTHLWAALDQALQKGTEYAQANSDQPVIVRVLTDGEDNDPAYRGISPQTIVNRLRAKYPTLGDSVGLVLLGSVEYHLKGLHTIPTPSFHASFPPGIVIDPKKPIAGQSVVLSTSATSRQQFDSFDWLVDNKLISRDSSCTTIFPHSGDYRVELNAATSSGQHESNSVVVHVGDTEPPSFTFLPARPEPGEPVRFFGKALDMSNPAKWFIDGAEVGTGYELQREFSQEGSHQGVFTVQIPGGGSASATNQIMIAEKPLVVGFDVPSEAVSGNGLQFSNTTSGRITEWRWDFGDHNSSNEKNPTHTYLNPGDKPVQINAILYARSLAGRSFASEPHQIIIDPSPKPPKAAFHVSQQTCIAGDLVNFLDDSTGVILGRRWSFAGEGESTLDSPEFAFGVSGEKLVSLTVTGPGGSDTITQKVLIQPRETLVKINLLGVSSPESSDVPSSIDFGDVNPDNLHQNTYIGIEKDTIEILFSRLPENASAVVASLSASNDVFHLQLRRNGRTSPLAVPARLTENSLIQVVLNTNAPEGNHAAELTFRADGAALQLNGTNRPIRFNLHVNIGSPDPSGFIAILVLIILIVIGWAIYHFWKLRTQLGPRSLVTIGLAEYLEPKSGSDAGAAARKFSILCNEIIVLGQSSDSPHIFDLQAPEWRIRRESSRIVLVNRRDFKSATVIRSGDIKEITTTTGRVRRMAVTIEIRGPIKSKPVKRTK